MKHYHLLLLGTILLFVILTVIYFDQFYSKNIKELELVKDNALKGPNIIPDVPKDAIPPLFFPEYVSLEKTDLNDEDFVLGFELNGDARAYPLKIMNFHEIVNDEVGGEEIVVTYCPLCRSGIVFSRILDGKELTFGNTGALYESAMVMYDKETNSYWGQIGGEAIKGELKGGKLKILPSNVLTFSEWKSLYPNTKLLSKNLGFNRNYDFDPYKADDRPELPPGWPISHEDTRLLPREKILGIQIGNFYKAYSLTQLNEAVVNDMVGGKEFVIFSTNTESGFVYERKIDGQILEFGLIENKILDKETNSEWDLSGKAIAGKLKSKQLNPHPSVSAFWFSWATIHPETELFNQS